MSAISHQPMAPAPYAAPAVLPHATRVKPHWSNILLATGCVAMALALALVVAGVPANMFYDVDGPGQRNENHSWDMLQITRSIDLNMKYIQEKTGYDKGEYNGYLTSISASENAVPTMAQSVGEMTAGVAAIDNGLSGVNRTTVQMGKDMQAMLATSQQSGATMSQLETSIGGLGGSMGELLSQTRLLVDAMGGIESAAGTIADKRTNVALAKTKELNAALPDRVPEPTTTLTAPRYQGAM